MNVLKLSLVALFVSALSFGQSAEIKTKKASKNPTMQIKPQSKKQSKVKWEVETHDFKDIEQGKPVSYEFAFTNTTNQTIMLTNVKASCGCTATNYTKTPIKPGDKGSVTATYNAARAGNFTKSITVTTNEEGAAPKRLIIKGKVLTKEDKSILLK